MLSEMAAPDSPGRPADCLVTTQVLTTDSLMSKIDLLADLAEKAGADVAAVNAIKYRGNAG